MIEEKYQDLNFEQSSFLEKSLFAIDVKDIFHLLISYLPFKFKLIKQIINYL